MDTNEFANDKAIDPSQLDVAAIQQADLFFKWASRAVDARAEMDAAKIKVELVEASLSIECRRHPEDFDIAKTTEVSIAAAVKNHRKYTRAVDRYLDARKASMILDKAVEAMEQRKRMLEILVTLHGQSYFAGPSVPHNIVETWREHQEQQQARVRDKQANRVRKRKARKER